MKWLKEDHFACFPGLKSFFEKHAKDQKNIHRKWFAILEPYQVGWVIKASEALMLEDGLMPSDHPRLLAAICQRLAPKPRSPLLDKKGPTEIEKNEILKTTSKAREIIRKIKADKDAGDSEATEGHSKAGSQPPPSKDTQKDDVALESESGNVGRIDLDDLRKAISNLEGKSDTPF